MLMKRNDIYNLYNCIMQMKKIKGTKFEFSFTLIEISKKIKDIVFEIDEKRKALQTERGELITKHCEKDEAGNAVVIYTSVSVIHKGIALGECPEYDERMKQIDDQISKLNKEEINVDIDNITPIKRKQCPEKEMNTDFWEVLEFWIEDFSS